MKSKSIFGAGCALLFIALGANAGTVSVDTNSYNFQLDGGGGGASATVNGAPAEIFCDNFNDEIWVPWDYSANVTTLGTGANLDETRFGGVDSTAWTTITLSDGNTTLDNQDDSFFNTGNGTSSLARYEMAAYLVSLYNVGQGNNTPNNGIQEAIWTILDPTAEGAVIDPSGVNPDSYLEQAVNWYTSMNATPSALNSFLSQFEILSDPSMTFNNGLGTGGFQEQIVMTPTATPEPRGAVWMLLFLMVGGYLVVRRSRAVSRTSNVSL
jgi:hypothetical protein